MTKRIIRTLYDFKNFFMVVEKTKLKQYILCTVFQVISLKKDRIFFAQKL